MQNKADTNNKNDLKMRYPEDFVNKIISMGSGTTAVAGKNLKRKYIVIDTSPEYCEMAKDRLKNGTITKNGELSIFSQQSFI